MKSEKVHHLLKQAKERDSKAVEVRKQVPFLSQVVEFSSSPENLNSNI